MAAFFLALVPQLLDLAASNLALQFAVLGFEWHVRELPRMSASVRDSGPFHGVCNFLR
jgi:threonine/homoserine/homoserine lactone efflux protein